MKQGSPALEVWVPLETTGRRRWESRHDGIRRYSPLRPLVKYCSNGECHRRTSFRVSAPTALKYADGRYSEASSFELDI